MHHFNDGFDDKVMNQDTAVMQALASTDKGLFDTDDSKDEDLEALNER